MTPAYQKLLFQEREMEYLEGRRVQQLFEEKKKQELLDGERRLLGEDVPPCLLQLPGWRFEREAVTPAIEVCFA